MADEHLATAITQAAMARLFEQEYTWTPDPRRTLIGACVDPERHEVGLTANGETGTFAFPATDPATGETRDVRVEFSVVPLER